MSDDGVPSPALRRAVQAEPAERHGLSRLPWEGALHSAVSALEAQLLLCRQENAELRRDISQLNAQLSKGRAWARTTAENWKLRQQAWHRERDELLARLGENGRRRR